MKVGARVNFDKSKSTRPVVVTGRIAEIDGDVYWVEFHTELFGLFAEDFTEAEPYT